MDPANEGLRRLRAEEYRHEVECGEHPDYRKPHVVDQESLAIAKILGTRALPAGEERRWEIEFVSHQEIAALSKAELCAAMGNALMVPRVACRQVLVREIKGRLEGMIPRG